jgi:hypothetical protein
VKVKNTREKIKALGIFPLERKPNVRTGIETAKSKKSTGFKDSGSGAKIYAPSLITDTKIIKSSDTLADFP